MCPAVSLCWVLGYLQGLNEGTATLVFFCGWNRKECLHCACDTLKAELQGHTVFRPPGLWEGGRGWYYQKAVLSISMAEEVKQIGMGLRAIFHDCSLTLSGYLNGELSLHWGIRRLALSGQATVVYVL